MEKYASMRPTWEHISLFEIISNNEVAQDTDRQAITERAMRYVVGLENYKNILQNAARQRIKKVEVAEIPASLKVRVDSQLLDKVVAEFKETFDIVRVKIPFLLRVTLMAYLQYINSAAKGIEEKEYEVHIQPSVIDVTERLTLNRQIAELLESTSENSSKKINKIKKIVQG